MFSFSKRKLMVCWNKNLQLWNFRNENTTVLIRWHRFYCNISHFFGVYTHTHTTIFYLFTYWWTLDSQDMEVTWWTLRLLPYLGYSKYAAMKLGCMYLFELVFLYPGMELLDHLVVLFSVFWETSTLFFVVTASIYIFSSIARRVPFNLHLC